MKAIIASNNKEYEVEVSKESNKLIIEYPYAKYFPWDILRTDNFNIEFKPTEEEIGCGCCKDCMTPIC